MGQIIIYKGRTVVVPVSLGFDVSNDTFASEIRVDKNQESDLIATWTVTFKTDGTDGELVLTLDNSITAAITHVSGYTDLKRVTGGEPVSVFDKPIEVFFQNTITI